MKTLLFAILFTSTALGSLSAQKYFTREGNISFFSDTPMEKIEADNSSATCVFDSESGAIQFAVLIKAFNFEKALMQEHFNENYLESSKYPKSTFKGSITNMDEIEITKDGEYKAKVVGDLTIHGVTKNVETTGMFKIKNGTISADAEFEVAVADYDIEVPSVVRDNIAKIVLVKVSVEFEELVR